MNKLYKTGFVKAIGEDVQDTRTVDFVISDESRDRDGTVIPIRAWDLENYERNNIVGWMHDVWGGLFSTPKPNNVIGSGAVRVEGSELIGATTFETKDVNPLADTLFKKVTISKTIKAVSVGFIPIPDENKKIGQWGQGDESRDGNKPTFYFGKTDLAEYSLVTIPSNPKATRRGLFSAADFFGDDQRQVLEHLRDLMGLNVDYKDLEKMTMGDFARVVTVGKSALQRVLAGDYPDSRSIGTGNDGRAAVSKGDENNESVPDHKGSVNRMYNLKLKK